MTRLGRRPCRIGGVAVVAAALAFAGVGIAEPPIAPPAALRVGVSDTPPFAIRNPDGSWSGIAVDLWRQVATILERPFTLDERPAAGLLQGLRDGSLDVVIGAIAITPAHGEVADFSHPYLSTTLAVAVRPQSTPTWGRILSIVLAPRLVHVLLAMGVVGVALGGLVWLLERRRNPGHFESRAAPGLWSAVWWAATTITTVGYGDKTPRTILGQAVAIVGMVIGILLVSVLTATFASEITLTHLHSAIRGSDDLRRVVVGTVSSSAAEEWLAGHGNRTRVYPGVKDALDALERKDVDAVVYHDLVLRYWTRDPSLGGDLEVLPVALEPEFLAFALPTDSELLKPLNAALLRATHADAWRRVLRSYLGSL